MDVALAARRRLGRQRVAGELGEQPSRQPRGVDELALRPAGVDVDALEDDGHLGARERLVLDLAGLGAVERVGAGGAEALDVEQRRALADLLVGREADLQRGAGELGVRGQVGDRGHDLGHAGLVVGAQQRVAAGGHDVVAGLAGQHRHVRRVEHRAAARQLDAGAVVVAVHDRLHARARRVRGDVDVGDQPDGVRGAVRGGQGGEDVAVVVERGVVEADRAQLVDEHPREVELAGGARAPGAVARGLRVDADVAQEALQHVGGERLRELGRVGGWHGLGHISPGAAGRTSRAGGRTAQRQGCTSPRGPARWESSPIAATPRLKGPGDQMNSLLHITHAQTIDQNRRRRRRG